MNHRLGSVCLSHSPSDQALSATGEWVIKYCLGALKPLKWEKPQWGKNKWGKLLGASKVGWTPISSLCHVKFGIVKGFVEMSAVCWGSQQVSISKVLFWMWSQIQWCLSCICLDCWRWWDSKSSKPQKHFYIYILWLCFQFSDTLLYRKISNFLHKLQTHLRNFQYPAYSNISTLPLGIVRVMRYIFDISGIEINPILWFNSPSRVCFESGFQPSSGDKPSNIMSQNRHMPVDRFRTIHRFMGCCFSSHREGNHMKSINSTWWGTELNWTFQESALLCYGSGWELAIPDGHGHHHVTTTWH